MKWKDWKDLKENIRVREGRERQDKEKGKGRNGEGEMREGNEKGKDGQQ